MLNQQELLRLKKFSNGLILGNGNYDIQQLDFEKEIDDTLTFSENQELLKEKINQRFPTLSIDVCELAQDYKTLEEKEKFENSRKEEVADYNNILLKQVFGENRIIGLAGEKDTGKTNNLMALIKDFRKTNKDTEICVFGLNKINLKWIKQFKKVYEISSIKQLTNKKDSLIIIDEFQRLRLNNKRYRELIDNFVDFIYHNNNWLILTSPNVREFNSVIGSKIEGWCLKSLKLSNLINGSQLKTAVMGYNGRFKVIDDISIESNELLIINDDFEKVLNLEYIKEADNKIDNLDIFNLKKSKKKSE